ncbi:hypothetical protein MMC18_007995 [Xylographa bjoerkii]|nr:hypothetical protein [Xylographa bjoerkii]
MEQQMFEDGSSQYLSYVPTIGVWITIIYLDTSNAIHTAILSDGFWQDYATWPTLSAPANNTKLSTSTILEPLFVEGRATNTTHFASTMVYQSTNGSIVMVDLDPSIPESTDFSRRSPPINPNIISPFLNSSADQVPNLGTSLSCIYNGQTANYSNQFFTACYLAEMIYVWEYNQSIVNDNDSFIRFNESARAAGNTQNTAKEVNLVLLDGLTDEGAEKH